MGEIPRISLKLNFTPNTLGCYGLKLKPYLRPNNEDNDLHNLKFIYGPLYQSLSLTSERSGTDEGTRHLN